MSRAEPDHSLLGYLSPTSTEIRPAQILDHADHGPWDEECDILVVGIGLAGTAAVLRAAEDPNIKVVAVDRGTGGGASGLSGGVVYAGATAVQRSEGIEDSAQNMANYLALETGSVVKPETLQAFANRSADFIPWLESHGARFGGPVTMAKTSYPGTSFLYFSGNERTPAAKAVAAPAPRGHRALPQNPNKASEQSGGELLRPLLASMDRTPNVTIHRQSRVTQLVLDQSGAVVGVEMMRIPPGSLAAKRHAAYMKIGGHMTLNMLGLMGPIQRMATKLEKKHARPYRIRATKGVVLSAGGYAFNRAMINALAPAYAASKPLGTIGDDGSGVKLGMTAGGATGKLDRMSAWRFVYPPSSWTKSVSVGADGRRLVSEELYGAQTGEAVFEKGGGKGWLILDSKLQAKVREEMVSPELMKFQQMQTQTAVKRYTVSANSLDELAAKLDIPAAQLRATIDQHNADIRSGQPDAFGKSEELRVPVDAGPFYATNIGAGLYLSPIPALSMGGLVVSEESGQVLDKNGQAIPGLYAAGRTAIGLCSHYYVSGLSLGDCMFSGWRAADSLKAASPAQA